MRYVNFLILLCAGVLFSCRQDPKEILPEFSEIESLMWDHPDSALARLEWMPKPSPSDKLNDATWCLLYTQAWDKNYKKHTSDSLIHVALRYFDKREDGLRKAQAWFYKGSVWKDLGKLEEATECYVRARDLIGSFDDPLFASLICQTLGGVYRKQKIYDQAFELFREAIHYVTRVPRRDDWSHAYSQLGRTFAECKQLDSARYYFERSLENAEMIKDLKMQSMAIGELGVVCRMEGDYAKALEYGKREISLDQLLEDERGIPQAKYGLGGVYYNMGILDSAKIYFQEALHTSNLSTLRGAYKILYIISYKQGLYKEAIDYVEQYRHYNDSITNMERTRIIAEAQDKYDNEKLENDLLLEKAHLQKLLFLGGIIVTMLIGLVVWRYQHKLWLKERNLRKAGEDIQEYISNIHENEETIRQNQLSIQSLSRDLEDKENLDGVIKEQKELIDSLWNDTEHLRSQNVEYQRKIDDYIRIAKLHEDKILKLEKLADKNLSLKNREAFLTDFIYMHIEPFKELSEGKIKLIDWGFLQESLNRLHNGFYVCLKNEFPSLSEEDLQVCCLIKSGLTTSQIAQIFGISAPSITRKKYRIRERMNQDKLGVIVSSMALDLFLKDYPQTKLSALVRNEDC